MSVKVEFTEEEARFLRGDYSGVVKEGIGDIARSASGKLTAAIAKHEREEKRKALGLPWRTSRVATSCRQWHVDSVHLEDESFTQLSLAINESQARLMAAAPEFAERLEEMCDYLEERGSACDIGGARAALKKAGW